DALPILRPQEHLLRDLLGLGATAEHAQRHAEHPMLVGGHQLFERARLTGPQAFEETGRIGAEGLAHPLDRHALAKFPVGAQSRTGASAASASAPIGRQSTSRSSDSRALGEKAGTPGGAGTSQRRAERAATRSVWGAGACGGRV